MWAILTVTEPTTHKAETYCGPRWDFFYPEFSMEPLKKPLTYEQQIERLRSAHNLIITDEAAAIEVLKKVTYYRLSAYGIGLKQKEDQEKYVDGITLSGLYRLYQFDSAFRNKLIHLIEQIEICLRTQIANYLALKYGSEGYVDPSHFIYKERTDGSSVHDEILKNFRKECERQRNLPFVKHHMEKYGGHFPIWVAVELFTFGNLSSLYSIMLPEDRKAIAALYDTEPHYLGSWLLALVEVRNICAHYSRLYNMPLKQRPFLYSESRQYGNQKLNKVFPVLITVKRMLNTDPTWNSFSSELSTLIEEYQDVLRLSFMGFPPNWKDILA